MWMARHVRSVAEQVGRGTSINSNSVLISEAFSCNCGAVAATSMSMPVSRLVHVGVESDICEFVGRSLAFFGGGGYHLAGLPWHGSGYVKLFWAAVISVDGKRRCAARQLHRLA